jgi:hypothetical protein
MFSEPRSFFCRRRGDFCIMRDTGFAGRHKGHPDGIIDCRCSLCSVGAVARSRKPVIRSRNLENLQRDCRKPTYWCWEALPYLSVISIWTSEPALRLPPPTSAGASSRDRQPLAPEKVAACHAIRLYRRFLRLFCPHGQERAQFTLHAPRFRLRSGRIFDSGESNKTTQN